MRSTEYEVNRILTYNCLFQMRTGGEEQHTIDLHTNNMLVRNRILGTAPIIHMLQTLNT